MDGDTHVTTFLFLYYPEVASYNFPRNVGIYISVYMVSYLRRPGTCL